MSQRAHSLKRQTSKQLQRSAVRAVIEGSTGPWSSESADCSPESGRFLEKPWLKKNWKGRKDEAWSVPNRMILRVNALRHETAGYFTGNASSTVWFCRPEEPDQGEIINWEQKNSVFTKVGCSHLFPRQIFHSNCSNIRMYPEIHPTKNNRCLGAGTSSW